MKSIKDLVSEKLYIDNYDKKIENDETVYKSEDGNITVEVGTVDTSNDIIRIIFKDKIIKYWYNSDILQTAYAKTSCDVIHEYNNIFK